jgi:hypothetical protein
MDFHRHNTALAPTAPTRRGRSVRLDAPASCCAMAAGAGSWCAMAHDGMVGKGIGHRHGRDSLKGADV